MPLFGGGGTVIQTLTPKGTYSAGSTYGIGDAVSYDNGTFVGGYASITAGNIAHTPDTSPANWMLMSKGIAGSAGPAGTTGATGPIILPPMGQTGTLVVSTGALQEPVHAALTIIDVRARVQTAPTGASVIVDLIKGAAGVNTGSTIFTTPSHRPTIAASTFDSGLVVPDVTALNAGDWLRLDIAQIGSTIAGANLVLEIVTSGGGDTMPMNTIATATYTLQLSDQNSLLRFTNAAGCALLVPNFATVPFPIQTQIPLLVQGAGGLTIATQSPALIDGVASITGIPQWAMVDLVDFAADAWQTAA